MTTKTQTITVQLMHAQAEVAALKAQLEIAALKAQLAAIPTPVAPVAARRDDWVPRYDACNFSRPVIACFADDNAAFEFRAEVAKQVQHPVAVRACRAPDASNTNIWAVY